MTTILFVFLITLTVSLVLTPIAGRLGVRFGAIDPPDPRKMHTVTLPRSGDDDDIAGDAV